MPPLKLVYYKISIWGSKKNNFHECEIKLYPLNWLPKLVSFHDYLYRKNCTLIRQESPNLEDYSISKVARKIVKKGVKEETRPTTSRILIEVMRRAKRTSDRRLKITEKKEGKIISENKNLKLKKAEKYRFDRILLEPYGNNWNLGIYPS